MTKPESETGKETPRTPGRKIPPQAWESAVEKAIREAMERGEFENLPGIGKPQDLHRDPGTPPEWELAFKLLRDAGYAPDWIEQDKEIRAARTRLLEPFRKFLACTDPARPDYAARQARLIADFRRGAAELNRQIDIFNLKAPSSQVHHARIRTEAEIDSFKQACARLEEE